MGMTIGTVAEAAGVNVPTIRYYERRGIIPEPPRTPSGYRQYDGESVNRIRFIKRAQDLGFTVREIEDLLGLRVDEAAACDAVEAATRVKLETVESKIRELERLHMVLRGLVQACEGRETTSECPVLAMLEEGEAR